MRRGKKRKNVKDSWQHLQAAAAAAGGGGGGGLW